MRTQTDQAAYSIDEFCESHAISRAMLYKLWTAGTGPKFMQIGSRRLIAIEAAAEWRREREQAAADMQAESAVKLKLRGRRQ